MERQRRSYSVHKGTIITRKTHLVAMMKRKQNELEKSGRTLYQAVGMAIPQLVQLVNKYQQQGYRVQLDTDTIELVDDVINDNACVQRQPMLWLMNHPEMPYGGSGPLAGLK
ncbi:RNAseP RNAse MRP subunit Pop6 [Schizosaccharomyces japonicus yFS275]|uniref:RNAseP RNAse MRP subunit Pop6 n=1 Tax=Schizosaccharomyces japonicus (strain yFS275 / FY16936) TaxID=402676 RepID=T0T6H6_SCHJY|nr:RNAseP RNAse MRP subunit Pop6 [Schizosaccharomyces japonicus yFS275]EQC53034.1 RNAseP RNAse MRP subunit Pop6 [Schizosaccharomyces japonicus yFS275]